MSHVLPINRAQVRAIHIFSFMYCLSPISYLLQHMQLSCTHFTYINFHCDTNIHSNIKPMNIDTSTWTSLLQFYSSFLFPRKTFLFIALFPRRRNLQIKNKFLFHPVSVLSINMFTRERERKRAEVAARSVTRVQELTIDGPLKEATKHSSATTKSEDSSFQIFAANECKNEPFRM